MKPYKTYKDSGIEWIDEIPSHWEEKRMKNILSFGTGLSITKQNLKDEGIPCVNYGEIHSKYGVNLDTKIHELKCVDEKFLEESAKAIINKGDFVFADTSEDIEGAGNFTHLKSEDSIFAGYHTITAKPKIELNSDFFAFELDSIDFRTQIRQSIKGVKVFSVTQSILKNTKIWLPPLEEQNQIANYLNHKTKQLDSLIAKKEQLIKLLEEERKAVINQAVTKGINPNVPMKNVNIDGLDEIPEHWKLMKFKWLAPILTCGVASTPEYVDKSIGVPFLSAQNVKNNKMRLDKYKYISVDLHEKLTKHRKPLNGDILVTRVGAGIGDACIVDCDFEFSVYVSLTHIRVDESIVNNKFIMYFFSTDYCKFLNNYGTVTGGGVGNLNVNNVERYKIPVPSLDEQSIIVEFIEKQNEKSNEIEDKLNQEINLLKEYKTALISEVVTGKIDVREEILN